jgi:hypothetical protein
VQKPRRDRRCAAQGLFEHGRVAGGRAATCAEVVAFLPQMVRNRVTKVGDFSDCVRAQLLQSTQIDEILMAKQCVSGTQTMKFSLQRIVRKRVEKVGHLLDVRAAPAEHTDP